MDYEPIASPEQWEAAVSARYPEYAGLIKSNLQVHRNRCLVLARRHRRWFRLTGVLTIVLSVSLPALTAVNFSGRNAVISVVAVIIAGLSALRAFYQWDRSWHLYRSQELALTALLTRWHMSMMRIIGDAPSDADGQAHSLTLDILHEAYDSGRAELSEFFSGISWPQKGA